MIAREHKQLFDRLAQELEAMSASIEKLGSDLCSDPAIVTGHFASLQELDRIAQMQTGIANIIRADAPLAICDTAKLEHLRHFATASDHRT